MMAADTAPAAVPGPPEPPGGQATNDAPQRSLLAAALAAVEPARPTAFHIDPQPTSDPQHPAADAINGMLDQSAPGVSSETFRGAVDTAAKGSDATGASNKRSVWKEWWLAAATRWAKGGGTTNKRLDLAKARAQSRAHQVKENRTSTVMNSGGLLGRSTGGSGAGPKGSKDTSSKPGPGATRKGPVNSNGTGPSSGSGSGGGGRGGSGSGGGSGTGGGAGNSGRGHGKQDQQTKPKPSKGSGTSGGTGASGSSGGSGASGAAGTRGGAGSGSSSGQGKDGSGKAGGAGKPGPSGKDGKSGKGGKGETGKDGAASKDSKDAAPGKDGVSLTKNGNSTPGKPSGKDERTRKTADPRSPLHKSRETGHKDGSTVRNVVDHVLAYTDGARDGYHDKKTENAKEHARLDQAHDDYKNNAQRPTAQAQPQQKEADDDMAVKPLTVQNIDANSLTILTGGAERTITRGELRNFKQYERKLEEKHTLLLKVADATKSLQQNAEDEAKECRDLVEAAKSVADGTKLITTLDKLAEAAKVQSDEAAELSKRALRSAEMCKAVLTNIGTRYAPLYKAVQDSDETKPAEMRFYNDRGTAYTPAA